MSHALASELSRILQRVPASSAVEQSVRFEDSRCSSTFNQLRHCRVVRFLVL